jgi:ABC-type sugar transport system substrate-binding protein
MHHRTSRTIVLGASITAVMLALTGCSASSAAGGTAVGVSLNSLQFPFVVTMNSAMKTTAKYNGVALNVVDSRNSVATELSQVEDLIQRRPKVIVLDPVDAKSSQAAGRRINAAGIPLVEVDNKFLDGSGIKVKSYIGTDAVESGRLEAEYINKALPDGGNILYLVGVYGAPWTDQRKAGFDEVLHKNIHVVTETQAQGSRAAAKSVMEDLLHRYPDAGDVQGVVAQNDEMALGAISAIQGAGRMKQFPLIVSVDGEPAGLAAIKAGTLTATVKQGADDIGRTAITVAKKVAAGQSVKSKYIIPYTVITKQNVSK